MSVQVIGSGTIGGIDEGLEVVGILTATTFSGNISGVGATFTGSTGNVRLDLHSTASGTGSQIKLHNDHGTVFFGQSGDTTGDLLVDNESNTNIRFFTNGTSNERLRITSTGQLLVGATSARTNIKNGNGNGATPKFQFETANVDEQNDISLTFGRNNAFGAEIILAKHRAATVGGYTVVQSGDRLGGINFAGSDGTHFRPAALIQSRVDGAPGTGDMPGRLEFHTTADNQSTPTEGLRIDAGGRIFTGNDSTLLNSERGSLHISGGGTSGSRVSIRGTATGAGNGLAEVFAFWDTNKVAGMIAFAGEDTTNKDDGKLNFYTADGSGVQARMKISKEGYVTKPDQPRALVKIYSTTTMSNGKVTNWATPTYNVGSLWDTSNKRFVAPVTGLYLVGGNFRIGAPGKVRVIRFALKAYNTSNVQMAGYGGGTGGGNNYDGGSSGYDHPYVSFTNAIYLQTGQYLELWLGEVGTEHTSYIQTSNEQSAMWCVLLQ